VPNPSPGTILGAYRVEGTLGAGSMGEVYKGVDTGLNRRVAIKILSEKHRDSPELRQRFVREGRAVAAISHPNVVQVFATGSFDERPYIAMELLDGTDLGTIVEKKGPLDSVTCAHVILDAAQGLAAASKAGLIHRDVKPSNLVRLADGKVKVTDFGLAKPVDPGSEPALTAMGVVVGTPDYIAPEQARGEPIDERVDIYALGGTLYYLLTGMPPFRTGKPAEDKYLKVVARHLRNPPPDATQMNPNIDRELAEVSRAMMSKKPAERPSYAELTARLAQILARLDPDAVPELLVASRDRSRPITLPPPGKLTPATEDSPTISEGDIAAPRPALPGWLWMLTVACLALFVVGLVMYLRRGGDAAAGPPVRGGDPPAGDATPMVIPVDAAIVDPAPPQNMLLVRHPDGSPWFYVDSNPVTVKEFRSVFARHTQPGNEDGSVVDVTYNEARSYAQTRGRRLLTTEEWDAASTTPNFIAVDGLYEWIESPDEHKRTVRQHGKSVLRPDKEQKDVTFRTAKDP
jgi:serine/threonine protein kinase